MLPSQEGSLCFLITLLNEGHDSATKAPFCVRTFKMYLGASARFCVHMKGSVHAEHVGTLGTSIKKHSFHLYCQAVSMTPTWPCEERAAGSSQLMGAGWAGGAGPGPCCLGVATPQA